MDIKRNLRKMILQEIYGKILLEQDTTAKDVADKAQAAVKAAKPSPKAAAPAKPKNDGRFVSSEAAQAAKDMLLKNAELFGQGVKAPTNGFKLDDAKARQIATDLYEATESWTPSVSGLMSGKVGAVGTDEEAILKALGEIPTLADLSHVSQIYSEKYSGYELAETLEEEYGTFTSDEFYDVRMAIQDIYKRGLFVLAGEVITIEKMEEIASIAAKNKEALEKAQGSGAEGGNFDLAGLVGGTAGAAGIGVGAAAGTGAALGVTGAAGVVTPALFGSAGAAAASAGAAAVTPGMGAAAGVSGILTAIPVGGWIALGVLALGVGLWVAFDNEEFNEQELKMLSPDFYNGLTEMFKSLSQNFRDAAAGIDPSLYPSESEAQESAAEGEASSDLGWGLEQPYVLNIIKTMNAYAAKKSLEGYTPPPEENKWSPVVQEAWLKFAPHALANCNLYSQFKISNVENWKNMSAAMRSKYPGYTPNPRGCLAFCLDAYYCELRYGNEAPSSGGGGRSGGGGGGGSGGDGDRRGGGAQKVSSKKITVELAQTGKSFKESGFSLEGGGDPDERMIQAILNEMSAQSKRAGYPGGILTFFLVIRGNRITDVRIERGGGQNAGLNYPYRNLLRTFEDIGNRLIFPEVENAPYSKKSGSFDNPKGIGGKGIKVTFNIPAGNVKDLRP